MKKRTIKRCRPFAVHTSIVKKSEATICCQWRLGNSFHVVFRLRSGAGSIPCSFKILATVLYASIGRDWPALPESADTPSCDFPPPFESPTQQSRLRCEV